MAEPNDPWQPPSIGSDNLYTFVSDGTVAGTKIVAEDGYELPGISGAAITVDAGKQVNKMTTRLELSAIEVKLTDLYGNVYTLKGALPADVSPGETLQGYDIDCFRPDGKDLPCHGFDLKLACGKDGVTAHFHHGLVTPDVKATDASGTYHLRGDNGQGFDCELLGPEGEPMAGVQWARYGVGPGLTLLEFEQHAPEVVHGERSKATHTVIQPAVKPMPDVSGISETLADYYAVSDANAAAQSLPADVCQSD